MAHFRPPESKREQFRRYLEKTGVLESLTSVLVALYEETEKPSDAMDFIKQRLGLSGPAPSEAEVVRLELMELQQQYEHLLLENGDLKYRLLQYESTQDDGVTE
ncbi:c-Myc-binding protein-like [Megalops cyprinoides]|uniref:c-Myc-binding protein-like n=1 Tax=Megalops cyprinoides TaxID=118141 RepID=UPI001864E171|nr:c-Myc-binding protein-like [Megalops cyprinoides]